MQVNVRSENNTDGQQVSLWINSVAVLMLSLSPREMELSELMNFLMKHSMCVTLSSNTDGFNYSPLICFNTFFLL